MGLHIQNRIISPYEQAPYGYSSIKSAYNGPDSFRVQDQLDLLKDRWQEWGPKEFMFRMCWIQPKPPEKGERKFYPTPTKAWNKPLVPFLLNRIQTDIEDHLGLRNIFLKPRQGGYTTYMIIRRILLQCILNPGHNGLLIGQNSKKVTDYFRILRRALKLFGVMDPFDKTQNTFANELKQHLLHTTYSNRRELVFDAIDTVISCESAEIEEAGQGYCLHPNTWIQTADNRYVRFKELKVGDWVLGSNGLPVQITKTFIIPASKHPYKGEAFNVYLRGSKHPIVCAPNHPFMTQRGMVEAQHLKENDYFAYPRREIKGTKKTVTLNLTPYGVRRRKIYCNEPKLKLNRDLGLTCGLYLADGHAGGNGYNHVIIKIMNDRKKEYALPRILSRMKSLCENPHVNGKSLFLHSTVFGYWVKENFGWSKTKHIPEWWADAPKEFLVGLLEGWLVGDGWWEERHIAGYGSNPKIVLGMKEIAIALGAMPYLMFKNGKAHKVKIGKRIVVHHGKRFKLEFYSYAHATLAKLFGLKTYIKEPNVRKKSQWFDDKFVYIKIDRIKKTRIKEFRDITVDSKDHLYCLPRVLTHNTYTHVAATEVARWEGNPEATLSNLKAAIPPGGTLDYESTANGWGGYFFEECMRSRDKQNPNPEFVYHFHEWWWHEEYELEPPAPEESLTKEEVKLVVTKDLSTKQIAWRRKTKIEQRHEFDEKYPEDDISCFLLSGQNYFDKDILRSRKMELEGYKPLEEHDKLLIYKKERPHHRYIIGADVASGLDVSEGSNDLDWSVATVIDEETGEFVARYRAHIIPEYFAWDLETLGKRYNDALIAVERNEDGGSVILTLETACMYMNLYKHIDWTRKDRKKRVQKGMSQGDQFRMREILGFPTGAKTRPLSLNRLRYFIAESPHLIHDSKMIDECLTFVRDQDKKGRPAAAPGCHDDIVMAGSIAQYVRHVRLGYLVPEALPPREKYGEIPAEFRVDIPESEES